VTHDYTREPLRFKAGFDRSANFDVSAG